MSTVRIVADDLTGALDAAAPFATADAPLPVLWDPDAAGRRASSFALDTESRDRARPEVLDEAIRSLATADVAFKKIDSLLRGRSLAEIRDCLGCGRFASVVIAPAFPAQQRITRGGRQLWRQAPDAPWQPLGPDLRRLGATLAIEPEMLQGDGHYLCDATSEAELAAIVAAGRRLTPPTLWVGTAGLARALAGPAPPVTHHTLPRPLLLLIGSHHPVTLAQVERLAAARPEAVVHLGLLDAPGPALARVRAALESDGLAALILHAPDGTGPAIAGPAFDRAFAGAAGSLDPPATLIVSGGATLHRLARALDAKALLCQGELSPGIAVSRLEGGRWSGVEVVSKSGGFGSPDLLLELTGREEARG